jgi:xanthine dehydrogenase YagR molybdenum-binding subunit
LPIEFRILNDTQVVPDDPPRPSSSDSQSINNNKPRAAPAGRPFSQR